MTDDSLVEWREWGREPFDVAERAGKPLLLSLSATWCVACHEMDRTTYADPQLAAHVSERFVPVRVDVDRQPRVRERYQMGGFPSTVFCTPDGRVISGAGFMSEEMLRGVLDSVHEKWDGKGSETGRVPRALRDPDPPAGEVTADVEAQMVEQVAGAFDEEFGGWGTDAKFPLPRTVEFAAKRDRDRATRTLEAVQTHLYDTYDGGFYRYASNRNWGGEIHREKLLDENAALVRAFATGYLYTGEDAYRETAEGTAEYLTTDLWTGDAFAGSQAGGDYFTLEPTEREEADPPAVDETVYADRNGLTADALFRLGAYTGDEAPTRYAERALDHVRETLVDGGEVRHFAGEASESGLLLDQARVLAGLTTAVQAVGGGCGGNTGVGDDEEGDDDYYLAQARAVADYALEHLQADEGAFLDGPAEGPGMLDRPLRPLETNVELVHALLDLAALVEAKGGDEPSVDADADAGPNTAGSRYRDAAGDALRAFAGAADRMGPGVADYAAACARYVYDPLVVETPSPGTDLHRAAWLVADHEKVVVPGDRENAVVVRGGERSEPASTPEELTERAADGPAPSP
jgi:uncharacterized protein YyaL (SSP411 family)